jgi:hypothetical protein
MLDFWHMVFPALDEEANATKYRQIKQLYFLKFRYPLLITNHL